MMISSFEMIGVVFLFFCAITFIRYKERILIPFSNKSKQEDLED
jgi:hypothetical protein